MLIPPPSAPAQAEAADQSLGVGTLQQGIDRLDGLWRDFVAALPVAGVGFAVLLVFVVAGRVVQLGVRGWSAERHKHRSLALATGRLVYGAAIILGFLVAAVIVFPNFTPTGLLTSLGIGSLVLGLAFKDVLQNYLAGILLLFAEPFRSGDQIIYERFEGTVEDVQPRATFIRTYDGRRVVIPNAELFTHAVTVNTAFEKRRVEYDVGIGYGDDIDLAKRLMIEAVRESGAALDEPAPEAFTIDLGQSSVNIRVRWWIKPPVIRETFETRDQVLSLMKEKLFSSGIDLPFPTTQILFHDQTEESDGDRSRQREGWPAGKDKPIPRPRRLAMINHGDTETRRREQEKTEAG